MQSLKLCQALGMMTLKKSQFGIINQVGKGLTGRYEIRFMSGYTKPPTFWKEPTLNELPVPQGSWDNHYKKMNAKNTTHLVFGVSFFIFTLSVLINSGLVTLNSKIPKLLGDDIPQSPGLGRCVPIPPKC